MSRWEDKYNKLMPNIDRMISEQTSKANEARRIQAELGANVDSAEYKQAKADLKAALAEKARLEELKPRLEKVKNIIEYRKQAETMLDEYYKVQDAHKKIRSNKEKIRRRKVKYQKLAGTIKDLTAKLQSGTLSKAEQSKINMQITKAANERQDSLSEIYSLQQENNGLDEELKGLKYGDLSQKEVDEQIKKLGATIVKCDIACSNLMNGKSIEDMQYDPSKHKYTRRKQKENSQEPVQEEQGQEEQVREEPTAKSVLERLERLDDYEDESFSEKQSWFAKIGNFFVNLKNRIFNRNETLELEEGQEEQGQEEQGQEEQGQTEPLRIEINLDEDFPREPVQVEEKMSDEDILEIADRVLKNDSELVELSKEGHASFIERIKVDKAPVIEEKREETKEERRKYLADKFDRHSAGPKVKPGFSKVDGTAKTVRKYEDKDNGVR